MEMGFCKAVVYTGAYTREDFVCRLEVRAEGNLDVLLRIDNNAFCCSNNEFSLYFCYCL